MARKWRAPKIWDTAAPELTAAESRQTRTAAAERQRVGDKPNGDEDENDPHEVLGGSWTAVCAHRRRRDVLVCPTARPELHPGI